MKEEWKKPEMIHGQLTKWFWLPYHPENIILGHNVDIGAFSCLFAHFHIEIGDNVQIGSHCSIYSYNTINQVFGKVVIKNGARIGSHCVILPNVIIEENELIKAGSIVYVNKKGKRIVKEVVKIDGF